MSSNLLSLILFLNIFGLVISQDAGSFLSQLTANYIPKNTRYYTLVNGIPVQESEGVPPDNGEIMARISSILPSSISRSPLLTNLFSEDENSFPNSWIPMFSALPKDQTNENDENSGSPQPGRRNSEGGFRIAQSQQYLPQESAIITLDDIHPESQKDLPSTSEFRIQSALSF